jgi:hypothetical protein
MSCNGKNKLKYSMYQSQQKPSQVSNNNNRFSLSNTLLFKLEYILSEDLAWDTPVVK